MYGPVASTGTSGTSVLSHLSPNAPPMTVKAVKEPKVGRATKTALNRAKSVLSGMTSGKRQKPTLGGL